MKRLIRRWRFAGLAACAVIFSAIPSCVELTGQRIAWFHDAARDELKILLFYDGIHDSGSDQSGKGVEQIPEFISDGDIMLLDFPFRIPMKELRETAQKPDEKPLDRDWARLLVTIRTEVVGYYRDLDGRIGAAQLITIPQVKSFVSKLNDLIGRQIVDSPPHGIKAAGRTLAQIQAAAKSGYQWVALDGHAIRLSAPVDPAEWPWIKGQFLKDLMRDAAREFRSDPAPEEKPENLWGLRALASVPISLIDTGDRAEIVLGSPKFPALVRAQLRDAYEPSLEKVVTDTVKADLRDGLGQALVGQSPASPQALEAVMKWGPPEEQVLALLHTAEKGDEKKGTAAVKRLESWGAEWNRNEGVPPAPPRLEKLDAYLAAWKEWCARMKQHPIVAEGKAKPGAPQTGTP